MKYILVTGGVISGVGKGIIASSIGTLLKCRGWNVTVIKIDPYINLDAGTFSPFEHGEVYVLDDGSEVDLDLGNYERFLDIELKRDNNITTGKIYQKVIDKERMGAYLGKTVQVIPHITGEIQDWVIRVAHESVDHNNSSNPDICLIELGGTVGDIESMPFIEAFRQFQFRVKRENFCVVHVSLIPQPSTTGEHKTKPTQMSVREMRGLGLTPDMIICRSHTMAPMSTKDKISMFCHVDVNNILSVPDVNCVYEVPVLLESQKVAQFFEKRLSLNSSAMDNRDLIDQTMTMWKELSNRQQTLTNIVNIGLVGKYTVLGDSYISVIKSLQLSAIYCKYKLNLEMIESTDLEPEMLTEDPGKYEKAWKQIKSCTGIIVPGGFGQRGVEGKIAAIKYARNNDVAFLGICLGMQCAIIEFGRNELNLSDANSTEFDSHTRNPLIIDMPEHTIEKKGGTMRLGNRTTILNNKSKIIRSLYNNQTEIHERHRHRYEFNPIYRSSFEKENFFFVGESTDGNRMEIFEYDRPIIKHNFYVGVQYHPEYLTRPVHPSMIYVGFILGATGELNKFLMKDRTIMKRFASIDNCISRSSIKKDDKVTSTD
ncbi:hypothetical protein SNEBB_004708 [Seison nebaliae]|nr:hypothetical protein SNEBB_004708 [Seison nebaliae]